MIFWKYVKGLNQGSTGGATPHPSDNTDPSLTPVTTSDERYTYIEFQPANNIQGNFTNTPWIYFTTVASGNTTHLGHIITSQATNQRIDTAFTFKKCVSFTNTTSGEHSIDVSGTSNFQNDIYLTKGKAFYFDAPTYNAYINANSNNTLIMKSAGILYLASATNNAIEFWQGSTKRAEFVSDGLNVTGDMACTNKCEAVYFNATSDKRAKTNLKPLEINALDLIKRVQLYSFKYKDSDLPSIGILAQDVQDVNIEGFDLVDNKQASGVDMDYMSIHESKLTYILWKAIQEQQKEIEELKAQIKNLIK